MDFWWDNPLLAATTIVSGPVSILFDAAWVMEATIVALGGDIALHCFNPPQRGIGNWKISLERGFPIDYSPFLFSLELHLI